MPKSKLWLNKNQKVIYPLKTSASLLILLSVTTSFSIPVSGWWGELWNLNHRTLSPHPPFFFLTFPNLHLTRLTMMQKTGRYAKCVCSPCLSFSAHNWAPYTRTCHAGSHCHWCFHPLSPVAPAVKSCPSFLPYRHWGSLNGRIHEGVVEFVPLLSLLTPANWHLPN